MPKAFIRPSAPQASAILGKEAFNAAADPKQFPEQLKYMKPWQALRLMTNLAAFNREQQRDIDKIADKMELDLGEYSPELGFSYNEIAGMSRSQHRSQAMGTSERMGAQPNFLTTLAGDKATKDIMEGVTTGWSRLPGGQDVAPILKQALDTFVPAHPDQLLPVLTSARPKIAAIVAASKDPWAESKLKDLDETIALVAGVAMEAQSDKFAVEPGGAIRVTLSAIVRNPVQVVWTAAKLNGMAGAPAAQMTAVTLANNQPAQQNVAFTIPASQPYSSPYWLSEPKDGFTYTVKDPRVIGDADNKPQLTADFTVRVAGTEITLTRPVQHKYVDRVWGELIRPLAIVPPVALDLSEKALVFGDGKARKIDVPVKSNVAKASGDVRLELPQGWKADPATRHFDLTFMGEQTTASFTLTPPAQMSSGRLKAIAKLADREVSSGTETITYPHIPVQTLFPPAEASLVRTDIKNLATKIGYVMGAGDEVPASLRQIGCEVTLLSSEDLARGDLSKFDTVITGVRAWNVRADLRANYQRLFDYANNGGTVIVQYNTAEGLPQGPQPPAGQAPAGQANAGGRGGRGGQAQPEVPNNLEHIGPYPIRLSRNDRVTVEEAPVTFPNPGLALLHKPNEITSADFDNWIQERGLYFATEWDSRYQSVLESHDPGEMPLPGGELYTKYGKGAYIFSAYDWFRELPAGVPGAYRLFANMMSAAKVQ